MQIFGPTQVHGAQSITAPHNARGYNAAAPTRSSANVSDELHISDSGRIAAQLSDIPAIRQDRVSSIRASIAQGTYDTDDKLSRALDNLLNEIG